MLDAARRYVEMGFSVIPLRPGSKEPLIKWQEFTQRKPTDAELSEWFDSTDKNLGVVTGSISGCVVIDVDGDEGLASAQILGLQSNTIALTGKGQQYFYRPPSSGTPLRNAVRILPGIDIRSDSGYVCAPPSIHPNGKRYTWLSGPFQNLPDFPENVAALIASNKRHLGTSSILPSTTGLSPLSPPSDQGWVSEALNGLAQGNRNDTFARVVGKLHHSGLDKATIWTLLLPYARANEFPDKELNAVLQSITSYPTEISAEGAAASAEQFLSNSVPVEWICDSICPRNSIGFAAGLPETYKTWILMDFAIECARGGGLWLGLFPIVGGRVLFIDQERSRPETQRRFKCLLAAKSLLPTDLKSNLFIRSGTATKLDIDESYRAFKRELTDIRPDVIIVDSFAAFQTSDENNRMEIQKVIERIKELRQEFGCAIIFIDHENKGAYSANENNEAPSAGRMAGSVGKIAAAEFLLTVRRYDPSTCAVYHTKSTMGPRVPAFAVHVVDTPGGGIRVYGESGAK